MELNELKELFALLKDTDITEFQMEKEGVKVKVRRERLFGHLGIERPGIFEKMALAEGEIKPEGKFITITSPIVGTFYRAPAPDAEPFVEIGSKVKKGQVLCVIEAMKLMNEIESEVDGVVERVLVENGHAVEYGEPLFILEPLE
jgi:acetyl-CoA carboxylase biotin carboxyl carrier protein